MNKKIKKSAGNLFYSVIINIIAIIICVVTFFPLWYIVVASLSKPFYVNSGQVIFTIKNFTLAAYKAAISTSGIWRGYLNTIIITMGGVAVSMAFSTSLAYALSRKDLPFRKFFTLLLVFTMWFSAGMIPFYQTMRVYKLIDSYFGIMIGFAISSYNVVILKSFFEQVPIDFEEAAKIDGAGTFKIFFQIFLPLSKAALATVGLFYGVSRWNGYFWASILFKTEAKQPLQVILKRMLVEQQLFLTEMVAAVTPETEAASTTISYAVIVISVLPMIVVYPFIQKYFKTGVTLGGVKG